MGVASVMQGTGKHPGYIGFGVDTIEAWGLGEIERVDVKSWDADPKLLCFQFKPDGKHKIITHCGMTRVHCQAALRAGKAEIGHYKATKDKAGFIIVNLQDRMG